MTLPTTAKELIDLAAVDNRFFCRTFFPDTFRQETPPFHFEVWDILEDRSHRQIALEMFRGGGKTTLLRAYTAKRIAYGTSRTIMYVSASQQHSTRSVAWLKKRIEKRSTFTDIYQLYPGSKWTEEFIEIEHRTLGITIAVIAVGITGQTRGINIDDYRPDLIVIDDPCDEENTATPEQREKTSEIVFGALAKSLSPATECPDAKMALLQTSLDGEDLINACHRDPSWASRKFSCFDEAGESRWTARYPTETLKKDKNDHLLRNQLALWLREMECTIVSPETSSFRQEWLKYCDTLPEGLMTFMAIDPLPPPSEREIKIGMAGKDYEVLAVVGIAGANFYLLDYSINQGHTPEWTTTEFFRLLARWNPLKVRVEGIAYQRTLKWILEQAMKLRGRYVQIDAPSEKRSKRHRILQAFSGICSQGRFFVRSHHGEFVSQFVSYPNVAHDDLLDAVAMALDAAEGISVAEETLRDQDADLPPLGNWRAAPCLRLYN